MSYICAVKATKVDVKRHLSKKWLNLFDICLSLNIFTHPFESRIVIKVVRISERGIP